MINGISQRLAFAIQKEMFNSEIFPFDVKTPKNKRTKPHMKYTLANTNYTQITPTMVSFDLGNETAEKLTPHYHILEDAKIIQNPYQGSKESRGSQARVRSKGKRDYSVGLGFDSTGTYMSEYRQAFHRGRRSYDRIGDKQWIKESNRTTFKTQNKFRYNIHFAYIERILEKHLPIVAQTLGLKLLSGRATMIPERMENEPNIRDMISMFHTRGEE